VVWTKKDSGVDSCGQEDGLWVLKEVVDRLVEQSSASHAMVCSSLATCCVSGVSPCCCVTVCGPRQQVALLAHTMRCGAVGGYRKHRHYLNYI